MNIRNNKMLNIIICGILGILTYHIICKIVNSKTKDLEEKLKKEIKKEIEEIKKRIE